jgi:hypothetical protein
VTGDPINRCFTPDGRYRFGTEERFYQSFREEGKRIIDKYVKVAAPVQKKIDDFYEKNMRGKKTIGIHLRGTEKHIERQDTDPMLIFEEANKQADVMGECQFFVATDEYFLLDLAKKNLKRPVIYYDCQRSSDGHNILYTGTWPSNYQWVRDARQGEDFLIEFILFSKCLIFMHTLSNASALPFYFNPRLKGTYFSPKGELIRF